MEKEKVKELAEILFPVSKFVFKESRGKLVRTEEQQLASYKRTAIRKVQVLLTNAIAPHPSYEKMDFDKSIFTSFLKENKVKIPINPYLYDNKEEFEEALNYHLVGLLSHYTSSIGVISSLEYKITKEGIIRFLIERGVLEEDAIGTIKFVDDNHRKYYIEGCEDY